MMRGYCFKQDACPNDHDPQTIKESTDAIARKASNQNNLNQKSDQKQNSGYNRKPSWNSRRVNFSEAQDEISAYEYDYNQISEQPGFQ